MTPVALLFLIMAMPLIA